MKNINLMTRKEFEVLPSRKWDEDIGLFDTLVILPSRRLHDSGYRCIDFVAVRGDKAICRLSSCSDVIHIEGIGGYGFDWLKRYGTVPEAVPPIGWSIDCLKVSGLLRLFAYHKLRAGSALSSFEIYAEPKEQE